MYTSSSVYKKKNKQISDQFIKAYTDGHEIFSRDFEKEKIGDCITYGINFSICTGSYKCCYLILTLMNLLRKCLLASFWKTL